MGMTMQRFTAKTIATRGQPATLVVPGATTQNAFGEEIEGPATEYPVTAILTRFSAEAIVAFGGIVSRHDLRVFLFTSPVELSTLHRLRIGALEYRVEAVGRRSIAAPIVAYDLQVRRI